MLALRKNAEDVIKQRPDNLDASRDWKHGAGFTNTSEAGRGVDIETVFKEMEMLTKEKGRF